MECIISVGIIVVIKTGAIATSNIDTAKRSSKKLRKIKHKFDINKLKNSIQKINEIIDELSEEQIIKLTRQIKKIIKKIIEKDKKSIEELAGELIKSHLLIKKDNIKKAEKRAKKVLKIAEKENHDVIIKEANNIIEKIHNLSEKRGKV